MGTNQSRDSLNCGTDQGSSCYQCEVELDHIQTWRYLTWVAISLTLPVACIFKAKLAAIRTPGGGAAAAPATAAKVLDLARMCYSWGAAKMTFGVAFLATFPSVAACKRYADVELDEVGHYIYPTLIIVFGIGWLRRGRAFMALAQKLLARLPRTAVPSQNPISINSVSAALPPDSSAMCSACGMPFAFTSNVSVEFLEGPLGMSFSKCSSSDATKVTRVAGQSAELGIKVGDLIASIGGADTLGKPQPEILAAFRAAGRPLAVRLLRPDQSNGFCRSCGAKRAS